MFSDAGGRSTETAARSRPARRDSPLSLIRLITYDTIRDAILMCARKPT